MKRDAWATDLQLDTFGITEYAESHAVRLPSRGLFPGIRMGVPAASSRARQRAEMKRLIPFSLAAGLLTTCGCISTHVVKSKAKPHWEYDPEGKNDRHVEGQAGYYALLPLTIVADVATCPFQLIFYGVSYSGTATIHGWPVPLH